ncbi:unnamed protein product [Hydatigera taeniaeformis]|uniref:SprT-like domain-containing protein n=1 Tax=Hydatigena taeniaeformis TaxID=6205 RepID=A0A3P7F5E8_HYDTA|nr:unnamed protein product [Hydatigera taeniaeformis]
METNENLEPSGLSCADGTAIDCDLPSISITEASVQSATECLLPTGIISHADSELQLSVNRDLSFAEEADCVPLLCLSTSAATTPTTHNKMPLGGHSTQHNSSFHNLSLRCLSPADAKLTTLNAPACSGKRKSASQSSDALLNFGKEMPDCTANSGSEALEDLLTQLKTDEPPKQVQSKAQSDISFVISDGSSSSDLELGNDPSFYHRIDNAYLKGSLKQMASLRNKPRFDSNSDSGDEVKSCDSELSETDEFYPHPRADSHPSVVDVPRRSRLRSAEKATHLKAIENGSTLPFIYSLSPLDIMASSQTSIFKRHPSAERFVKNFKKNREELANRLLTEFNEAIFANQLPGELRVIWNERLLKTAGQCVYLKRNSKHPDGSVTSAREVRIELSGKVCTSAERVRDTLLHEACHAAVWLVHGLNDGHGPLWRSFARRAKAVFPHLPPITVRHTYAIDTRFTYRCSGCLTTINRHSKSLDIRKKVCLSSALFVNKNGKLVPVNSADGKTATTAETSSCPRSVFADFVKVHYREVRGASSTHKDAMVQLSSMFHSMKLKSDQEKEG